MESWFSDKLRLPEFLSFCVTWHLHNGRESCDVGLKSDLFRGIRLSEQFLYLNKVLLLRFLVLRDINSRFCSKTQ